MLTNTYKTFFIFLGDSIVFLISLILTLILRYKLNYSIEFQNHLGPFFVIFILCIVIFYIFDLYSERFFKHDLETIRTFFYAIVLSILLSISAFYAFGTFFELTPKTNLLIFWGFFAVLDYGWRFYFNKISIRSGWQKKY